MEILSGVNASDKMDITLNQWRGNFIMALSYQDICSQLEFYASVSTFENLDLTGVLEEPGEGCYPCAQNRKALESGSLIAEEVANYFKG